MSFSIPIARKIVALRAVGVGRLMRQAIYANDLARYDQISTRVTAGRNAAAQRILDASGTLHACPPLGGNSFFAQVAANVVRGTFVDDLKRAFLAQAGDVRLGVGVGDDLLSAVEACERDVSASPSPDLGGLGPLGSFPTVPESMHVLSGDGNRIGQGLRQAIESNRMSAVDAYSDRVTAGMDAAIQIARGAGGTIYGAGGDNFSAVIYPNSVDVPMLKLQFQSASGGLTMAVGVGPDLLTSYENLVLDKPLYLAFLWPGFLEQSFEDDFRLR